MALIMKTPFDRLRIIPIFSLGVAAPFLALVIALFSLSLSSHEDRLAESVLQTLTQAERNMARRIQELRTIAEYVALNEEVGSALASRDPDSIGIELDEHRALIRVISGASAIAHEARLRLFVSAEKIYSRERSVFFPLPELDGKFSAALEDGLSRFSPPAPVKKEGIQEGDSVVVTYARPVRAPDSYYSICGMLLIDVLASDFFAPIDDIRLPPGSLLTVYSESDKQIHPGQNFDASLGLASRIDSSRSGDIRRKLADGRRVVGRYIDPVGWRVEVILPRLSAWTAIRDAGTISAMLIIALGLSFSLIGLIFAVFALVGGIRRRAEFLIAHADVMGVADEHLPRIRSIGTRLDNMLAAIVEHAERTAAETFRLRLEKREAELRLLQAQINPHFLYNTLDTIKWLALRNGGQEVADRIGALGRYFRLTLSKGKDVIPLDEELELVRLYVGMQNDRYHGFVRLNIYADPSISDFSLPKLTIQPLVENSIVHGILGGERKRGMVSVAVSRKQTGLEISVSDDGAGMSEVDKDSLLSRVNDRTSEEGGFGFFNVIDRLNRYFETEIGISIDTRLGRGTEITLRIPYVERRV